MGVPKFYRWISERYPCLSEVVKEYQIPEFDNLYLDMNGIIHQCSHPNDEDVHFRISEEKIFADIFHYLEVLFRIIKPRKVFFMAVDGVAPRAKMNQQRGRRFRSAKEAEEKIKKALEKGEVLPVEARFDSNCITPGTDFMARLQEQLKYFVHSKLSTDKLWQGVSVYLSGHETPGEGEHKIMEFIRSENAKPGHDPNTRHCLYGLDADLIMLGLVSHEPHFSLLREEVRFGGKKCQKRITAPEETTFHLLHLSLMREYIDYEFSELRNKIGFEYDLERIIDDWILMGFLVGNDFIPHLPHLHINQDALPLLYRTYISVLPSLGGYLNENGNLSLTNFEKYLVKLSEFDRDHFREVFVDLKWFESKVGNKYVNEAAGQAAEESRRRVGRKNRVPNDSLSLAVLDQGRHPDGLPNRGTTVHLCVSVYLSYFSLTLQPFASHHTPDCTEDDCEDEDMFETEFRQYKRSYYMTKMGVEVVSDDFLASQALCYVEGIQWILHYYYHGVQSWSWFYPYHYAPFLSDIRNISSAQLSFQKGTPFLPFQQLLAVLPAASKDLLPQCYQHLMTSPGSPIIEYYPLDFKTDLNGKQQEWEAVVLIPFIDEKRLLAAMEPYNELLSAEEKARNRHSECALYRHDMQLDFCYMSPLLERFPHIPHCHVRQTMVPMDAWQVPLDHRVHSVDSSSLYFCGFPTLRHIRHKFYKRKSGVVVFQQSSRGENMMLEILNTPEEELCEQVAALTLGRTVFVNWPHLEEARVVAVSDGETRFFLEDPPGLQKVYMGRTPPPTRVVHLSDKEQKEWLKEVQSLTEHFLKRKGIVINETAVLLYAQLLAGRRYVLSSTGRVHLEKQWAKQALPFAHQTIVKDIKAFESSFPRFKTLEELFPRGTLVFMMGNPYYGAMGEVQESGDVIGEGRVRVVFTMPCEPQLDALIQNQHKYSVRYSPGYVLSSRLGVSSYLVSRFSGSVFIGRGSRKNPHGEQKSNVGLNLKFNKKNEEVPGYTKRTEKEWLYSAAVEELLAEYLERFPEVFEFVSRNSHDDVFYEDDIWPGEDENGAEKVQEILSWLKTHPVSSTSRTSCDLRILDSGIVEKIEEELDKTKLRKSSKKVRVTVKPHLLFRPLEQQQGVVPDPDVEYRLFDRVVNVRESFTVPLGLRGTVIGIKGADRETDVLYEVLFDEEFPGGLTIRCSQNRGYRLPPSALVNLSHGSRLESGSHKLTAVVKPQVSAASHGNRGQLGALNHSPCSPFVPTQQPNGRQGYSLKAETQGSKHSTLKFLSQKNSGKAAVRDEDFGHVWQSLQASGTSPKQQGLRQGSAGKGIWGQHEGPQEPGRRGREEGRNHCRELQSSQPHHPLGSTGNIRVLKRNEDVKLFSSQNPPYKVNPEFEESISSLSISLRKEASPLQTPSSAEEPLSPQSFAMKGTLLLKEMLKIDTASGVGSAPEGAHPGGNPVSAQAGVSQGRRRSSKKLAARIHKGSGEGAAQPYSAGSAAELTRVCLSLGMGSPEFTFLRNPQGLTVCQVKVPSGLLVHGPQCQSDSEAKEKAALFTLQRLSSIGSSLHLTPPLFSTIPAPLPAVYGQPTGGLLVQPLSWGACLPPQTQPFYPGAFPGARSPAPTLPIGSHNQFVPMQVTKKRVSGRKFQEPRDLNSSSHSGGNPPPHPAQPDVGTASASNQTPDSTDNLRKDPPMRPKPGAHTPGFTSRRKPRKLAANFESAKVSE
ncbi:5'-3' exoribonuclease 1 isoform X3 [Scleropages formosus]|uniref:5'-3' exoribonuclease 1 isoform X3 n=1 Tax=Scleropages formosus TaxID=113540 RepID=UPI0008788060|nr:5'-3' exoribonuclease 1 isoform X3 [Scleropages formosus]